MSSASRRAAFPLALAAIACALPLLFVGPFITVHVLALAIALTWLVTAVRFAMFAHRAQNGRLRVSDGKRLKRLAVLPWLATLATPVLVIGLAAGVAGGDQAGQATLLAKALSELMHYGIASLAVPLPATVLAFVAARRLRAPPKDAPEGF